MIMGKFVQGKTFKWTKYLNAIIICAGLGIFRIYDAPDKSSKTAEVETAKFTLGAFLLLGYVMCDSFTSNWQVRRNNPPPPLILPPPALNNDRW